MKIINRETQVLGRTANSGFTFIELLITLVVLAVAFLPLIQMFTVSLEQIYNLDELTTARYLAQEGMEKTKNLNFTKAQLKELGNVWEPPLNTSPLVVNKREWRVLRKINLTSDPLEVSILVFKNEDLRQNKFAAKPVAEVVTLFEDYDWTLTQ